MIRRLLVIALVWASGCAVLAKADTPKVNVVASFSIIADIVRQVGGDRISLKVLVPQGRDPHSFEASPHDAKALRAARLLFVNGLGLDDRLVRFAAASGFHGSTISVSGGITPLKTDDDDSASLDPHAWMNPKNGIAYVKAVAAALAAEDPEGAPFYGQRARSFIDALFELDGAITQNMTSVPEQDRKILTTHDALRYFGRAYGITFLAVEGLSPDAEPSAAAIAALIETIRREGVKVYFLENGANPRLVKQVAQATGAALGGELYVETLSDAQGPAPDYVAMLRHDAFALIDAMKKGAQ